MYISDISRVTLHGKVLLQEEGADGDRHVITDLFTINPSEVSPPNLFILSIVRRRQMIGGEEEW